MKKHFLILLASIACFCSCNKPVDPDVSLDRTSFGVGFEGGEFSLVVNCNTDWDVVWDLDGISVDPVSGMGGDTVRVSIPPTREITTQQTTITFYASDAEGGSMDYAYCRVTQAAYPYISCSDASQEISADGGKVYFHVNSSRPWVAEFPSGAPAVCDLDPMQWRDNAVEVYLTVPASNSPEESIHTVLLKLKDYPQISTVLTVKQAARVL